MGKGGKGILTFSEQEGEGELLEDAESTELEESFSLSSSVLDMTQKEGEYHNHWGDHQRHLLAHWMNQFLEKKKKKKKKKKKNFGRISEDTYKVH